MKIKLVGGNSAGTVTSFYMASLCRHWCELDFEFMRNVSGEPYFLQTNVFTQGKGNREQRIFLWFDPTADYHEYGFLWNQNLILWVLVDKRVIRTFHNAKDLGISYLEYQTMYIFSSIWNGELWATCAGRVKPDSSQQPFVASYSGFNVGNACPVQTDSGSNGLNACYDKMYQSSYGEAPNLELSQTQIEDLQWVQKQYLIFDYCEYEERVRGAASPECGRNWRQELDSRA